MQPRIHVVTLAVDDLDRSMRFYRDGLGLETPGIGGTEFVGDADNPGGAVAMFTLGGGLILSLYGRDDLAKDAGIPVEGASSGDFSLGHIVPTREAVDELLEQAVAAGAQSLGEPHDRPWGIYSAYFKDPDGHLWEIVWNPDFELGEA